MPTTILIAGGSGLIGEALVEQLQLLGYRVRLLGRKKNVSAKVERFIWNPKEGTMDQNALVGTDVVINLAGANVGQGRWTKKRKEELISSRTLSTQLLVRSIIKNNYPIKKIIQASAIGYYGFQENDVEFTEEDPAGKDFLAQLTEQWERATEPILQTSIDLLVLRIGVVLSNRSGALIAMAKPIKMMVGAPLGSGSQIVPWIHISDLIAIILMGIEQPVFVGCINAVSPNPITNMELTKAIGLSLKRPIWPIHIPSFILKLILGEQAQIVLKGNKISARKLLGLGFKFQHEQIKETLNTLLTKSV